PLFEYECRGCGTHFEYLTRDGQSPSCPACKGADLQKKLSVFAAQSSTPAKSFSDRPMQACGSCGDPRGPGSCSMNQRSEEHTSELQSRGHLVCRLLLEKKKLNYASLP